MAEVEYRCFVGGLAWATTDESLENAFSQFGDITDSKVRFVAVIGSDRIRFTQPDVISIWSLSLLLLFYSLWLLSVTVLLFQLLLLLICFNWLLNLLLLLPFPHGTFVFLLFHEAKIDRFPILLFLYIYFIFCVFQFVIWIDRKLFTHVFFV